MAEKIEGYRDRNEEYKPLTPKSKKLEMKAPDPQEGNSMSEFRKSMEDHQKDISSGRGNGIPDNYKEKKSK
jgi:hypothetical protein